MHDTTEEKQYTLWPKNREDCLKKSCLFKVQAEQIQNFFFFLAKMTKKVSKKKKP